MIGETTQLNKLLLTVPNQTVVKDYLVVVGLMFHSLMSMQNLSCFEGTDTVCTQKSCNLMFTTTQAAVNCLLINLTDKIISQLVFIN